MCIRDSEYTVREDILMAMEELELPDAQAKALLASPSPLADAYREFEKRETGYMDVVRDSIESRAEAALDAQRELPVYRHSAAYAHAVSYTHLDPRRDRHGYPGMERQY